MSFSRRAAQCSTPTRHRPVTPTVEWPRLRSRSAHSFRTNGRCKSWHFCVPVYLRRYILWSSCLIVMNCVCILFNLSYSGYKVGGAADKKVCARARCSCASRCSRFKELFASVSFEAVDILYHVSKGFVRSCDDGMFFELFTMISWVRQVLESSF